MQPGTPPSTPLDMILWLEAKLHRRQQLIKKYQNFYDSEERTLSFAQEKFEQEFGDLFLDFRDNFCALVPDSISERLKPTGFRMSDEPKADKDAQEIWQRNFMDSESNAAHISSLVTGESYIVVWADEDKKPIMVPESGDQMVVQYRAGTKRVIDYALKQYRDDWGTQFSTLWTPKGVYTTSLGPEGNNWQDPVYAPNPLGEVPVIPLTNRSRLNRPHPYSELHPIIPLQQAITKIAADAIVASEFAAYPQRLISGIELPEDADGTAVSPIKAAVDRLIMLEGDNVKWGQFTAADLSNYVNYINMLVQHISTISRVPPHYFLVGGANFPSGEALIAAEAGLVAKARERMLYFGESWERAMRMAFKVMGDPRAEAWNAETIWADPEHRSESQKIDALGKKAQLLQVPARQLWEEAGYTQPQMDRFPEMQEEDLQMKMKVQKAMSAITGAEGGSAPAGNGTKAPAKPQGNAGNNNRKTATTK